MTVLLSNDGDKMQNITEDLNQESALSRIKDEHTKNKFNV